MRIIPYNIYSRYYLAMILYGEKGEDKMPTSNIKALINNETHKV